MIEQIVADYGLAGALKKAGRDALEAVSLAHDARSQRIASKIFDAFIAEGVAESDFAGTLGYGYDDRARARYESLLCRIFKAEAALARLSLVSGTQAIVAALAACVQPRELLVSASGAPYDTLRNAISEAPHSLESSGRRYREVPLQGGNFDLPALRAVLQEEAPAAIFIQRSRGYSSRPSLSLAECERAIGVIKELAPSAIVVVDNCYGELVEEREPIEIGADLAIGSLIKNLGGTLAPSGAYIAGKKALIEKIAAHIYAPGLRADVGPTLGFGRTFMQGLFVAPHFVAESLRGLDFAAALFCALGFAVDPQPGEERTDTVQAIRLGDERKLLAFAAGLQRGMPVNARFRPEPGPVPGYTVPVVMSSGGFISGATSELSCDAPLRPPFEMYLQGGTTFEHTVAAVLFAADAVLRCDPTESA